MKKIKHAIFVLAGGLFALSTAITSCDKDDDAPVTPVPAITSFTPVTAAEGATVTITGSNFTGATAVAFGGTAATSFNVVSATSITAVVGAGTSGSITVVTPGGTASKDGFTFSAPLPPVDGYTSSNEVEAADLISHWPFDGNLTERIHTATPILTGGDQTFVTGRIGQAAHFAANGTSPQGGWLTYDTNASGAGTDNTGFSSNNTLQDGFTLTMWGHLDATDLLTNIFQLSSPNIPNWPLMGLAFRKHVADNSFDMDFGLGNVDGTGPHIGYASFFKEPAHIDSLDWAFWAITYDAATKSVSYYANGILRATYDLAPIFPDPTASLLMIAPNYATIGTFEGQGRTPGDVTNTIPAFMSDGIKGDVDDIRLFKKTLSAQKLTDLYILGNQGR